MSSINSDEGANKTLDTMYSHLDAMERISKNLPENDFVYEGKATLGQLMKEKMAYIFAYISSFGASKELITVKLLQKDVRKIDDLDLNDHSSPMLIHKTQIILNKINALASQIQPTKDKDLDFVESEKRIIASNIKEIEQKIGGIFGKAFVNDALLLNPKDLRIKTLKENEEQRNQLLGSREFYGEGLRTSKKILDDIPKNRAPSPMWLLQQQTETLQIMRLTTCLNLLSISDDYLKKESVERLNLDMTPLINVIRETIRNVENDYYFQHQQGRGTTRGREDFEKNHQALEDLNERIRHIQTIPFPLESQADVMLAADNYRKIINNLSSAT